jgi:hypothetical protein
MGCGIIESLDEDSKTKRDKNNLDTSSSSTKDKVSSDQKEADKASEVTPPAENGLAVIRLSRAEGPPPYNLNIPEYSFKTPMGEPEAKLITITNDTKLAVTDISASDFTESFSPFHFVDHEFPGKDGTCTLSLQPGESCELHIEFATKAGGSYQILQTINFKQGSLDKYVYIYMIGSITPVNKH